MTTITFSKRLDIWYDTLVILNENIIWITDHDEEQVRATKNLHTSKLRKAKF